MLRVVASAHAMTKRNNISRYCARAFRAILAAEKIAEEVLSSAEVQLDGIDKKKIADQVYALLPDNLVIGGRTYPIDVVKSLISRDQFERLIKDKYDEAAAFIARNREYLKSQVNSVIAYSAAVGKG